MSQTGKESVTPADPPSPAETEVRRFLGRRPVGQSSHALGAWLFLSASLLFIAVIVLAAILLSFKDQLGDRLLITAYTPVSKDSGFEPLPFVNQDAEQLRQTPGLLLSPSFESPQLANFFTGSDFERLIIETLPAVEHQTLILAIRCHSIATNEGIFLQPTDGNPVRPESGVSFRRLLAAVAECPAENKILLLDIAPVSSDLGLSLLRNDAISQVQTEFQTITNARKDLGSLRILTANFEGQASGTIFACQKSAFSMFAAYALDGGSEVETPGMADGIITADELMSFVENSLADWSLGQRSRIQRPVLLKSGPDFPLASVKELSSLSTWMTRQQSLAEASVPEIGNASSPPKETASAEATKDAAKTVPVAQISIMTLQQRVIEAWRFRFSLRNSQVPIRRPWHWMLLAQHLQRAEKLILSGELEAAQRLLNTDITPLQEDLTKPISDTLQFPWTSGFDDLVGADNMLTKPVADLASALKEPTTRNLASLSESPFVEASLLRRLASEFQTKEGQWTDPARVEAVMNLRRVAERTGRLAFAGANVPGMPEGQAIVSRPWLLPFLKSELEKADSARNSAEQALLLHRLSSSDSLTEQSIALYARAQSDVLRFDEQLQEVHLAALDAVPMMRWLGAISTSSVFQDRLKRLNSVMRGITQLGRTPRAELLPPLLGMVRELRRLVANDVREALDKTKPEEIFAALELPFLDPQTRSDLLSSLIGLNDRPRQGGGLRQLGVDSLVAPPCPFSLDVLRDSAGVLEINEELARRFSPESEMASGRQDSVGDEATTADTFRTQRYLLAQSLRTGLGEIRLDPFASLEVSEVTAWEQYLTHLFRTPFQAALLSKTRFEPVVTDSLTARMSSDHLVWELRRLQASTGAAGLNYSKEVQQQIIRNLQKLAPELTETLNLNIAAFDVKNTDSHPAGENVQVVTGQFLITPGGTIPLNQDDSNAYFVVDWYAQRDRVQVLSVRNSENERSDAQPLTTPPTAESQTSSEDGNLVDRWRLRLPIVVSAGSGIQIAMDLKSLSGPVTAEFLTELGPLTGWIELGDGSQWLLPLQFQLSTNEPEPAEVLLTDSSGRLIEQQVNLLPNESLALSISVVNRRNEAQEVILETSSGTDLEQLPLSLALSTDPIPVMPAKQMQVDVNDGRIEFRIVRDGSVVHRRSVDINILNPATCFEPSVRFDVTSRKLDVRVRSLKTSDTGNPCTVELAVKNADVVGGQFKAVCDPASQEAVLEATIAENRDLRSFVAEIGAAGVARLYEFQIDAMTGEVTRLSPSQLQIDSPLEFAVYPSDGQLQSLDVHTSINFPRSCEVYVGIDRNEDGYLNTSERESGGRYWSGRSVKTLLEATTEPGAFSIRSTVQDISLPVNAAGLTGPQRILVQLLAGDQSLTKATTVYFLNRTPDVEFVAPTSETPLGFGSPVTVRLKSDPALFRAVEEVEVGVDRNNNGLWDTDETLASIDPVAGRSLKLGPENLAIGVFDSQQLLPKEPVNPTENNSKAVKIRDAQSVTLMARGTLRRAQDVPEGKDAAESKGTIAWQKFQLVDPSQVTPATGAVGGVVSTVDGLPQRNVIVALGELTTKTDEEGRFLFKEVPVGKHAVTGTGTRREGLVEAEVQQGKTAQVKMVLRLR